MRPVRLAMSAFGSYASESVIYFDGIDGGVFLISGDTGAGKTTIFDAISYALFDVASGDGREAAMLRSKYAAPDEETYVELDFIYRDKLYKIRRSPEYMRYSKRRDSNGNIKEIRESSSVRLILPDNTEFTGKKADINREIIRILGIDGAQFKHIAMIAQGDFRKLLYAESGERRAIFARIFDTAVYAELEKILKEEASASAGRLSDIRRNIERSLDEALRGLESEEANAAGLSEKIKEQKTAEDKLRLLGGLLEALGFKKSGISDKRALMHKEFVESSANLKRIEENNKLADRLEEAFKNAADNLAKTDEYILKRKEWLKVNEGELERLENLKNEAAAEYELKFPKYNEIMELYSGYDKAERNLGISKDRASEDMQRAYAAKQEFDRIYSLFIAGQAGLLAAGLKDGEPCPVCGSASHPSPALRLENTPDKAMVDRAKTDFERAEAKREESRGAYGLAESEFNRIIKRIGELKAKLPKENTASELKAMVKAETDKLIDNKRSSEENSNKLAGYINRAKGELEVLNNRRPVEEAALKRAESDKKSIKRLEDNGLKELNTGQEKELKRLEQEEYKTDSECRLLETLIKNLKELYMREASEAESFDVYERLSRTASGQLSGSVKLDFETYIQRYYFRHIIARANIRLGKMNSNAFLLKCRDLNEAGLKSREGLSLDIIDIANNSVRDVKTLSGGEAFMAALSMALGLSDIIQESAGGIRLETMFIDEGFGSLDSASRQQAMAVLEELADKSRLIGIISHVSELKEQVENKLTVRKTEKGSYAYWEGV